MAINTFAGTSASVGRILVTWTLFGTTNASPIMRSYSNDHGATWSSAAAIHAASTSAQGSQPVFLHDGRVGDHLLEFCRQRLQRRGHPAPGPEEIDMVLSNDGGVTFGAPTLVTTVARYNQPSIRNGVFLPSATTDRTTGNLYVVYQGLDTASLPRILFTKSTNAGASWSAPDRRDRQSGHGRLQLRHLGLARWANAYRLVLRSARQRRQHPPLQSLSRPVIRRRRDLAAEHSPNECHDRRQPRAPYVGWLHAGRLPWHRGNDRP